MTDPLNHVANLRGRAKLALHELSLIFFQLFQDVRLVTAFIQRMSGLGFSLLCYKLISAENWFEAITIPCTHLRTTDLGTLEKLSLTTRAASSTQLVTRLLWLLNMWKIENRGHPGGYLSSVVLFDLVLPSRQGKQGSSILFLFYRQKKSTHSMRDWLIQDHSQRPNIKNQDQCF